MNPAKRVLIIDDEPDILNLVSMRLEAHDFHCFTASSAEEGLVKAQKLHPKLILLDLMLPKMSGLGFLRELSKDPELSEIPVIILTALGDKEVAMETSDLGARGYLRKTCKPSELVAMVERYSLPAELC